MAIVAIWIEYDGTAYHGWQRQADRPTVQAAVESAVRAVSGERITVIAAGRTDAGVHAAGQVAHFSTEARLGGEDWVRALNRHLPGDVSVLRARRAASDFHARYAALRKLYRYDLIRTATRRPLRERTAWAVAYPLDRNKIQKAAKAFLGRHSFKGFGSADPSRPADRSLVCTVRRMDVLVERDEWRFEIEANRFLYHMARRMVGLLIEIGRGRFGPESVSEVLAGGSRIVPPTAPARGLCLVRVTYSRGAFADENRV